MTIVPAANKIFLLMRIIQKRKSSGLTKNLQRKITAAGIFLLCLTALNTALLGENNEERHPLFASRSLSLDGFIQARYTNNENIHDGFSIKRARVGLDGNLTRSLSFKLQVDAVESPALLDAQINVKFAPQAVFSVGQFKPPFSLENLTSSHSLDTINRSYAVDNFCPGRDNSAKGRDIGIMFSGEAGFLEYHLGIFNGAGINRLDDNDHKDIAGRILLSPFSFFSVGISHYNGRQKIPSSSSLVDRDKTGLDVYFHHGPFSLKGEYIMAKDHRTDKAGWYLQGAYTIIPEQFQAVVKYDALDENKNAGNNVKEKITLGINWFFSEKTKLQVNYEFRKEGQNGPGRSVILTQFQAGF